MGKNKNRQRSRGVPIAWDAEVRAEQAAVQARLAEARAEAQRRRREAIEQMERDTREAQRAIKEAETPEAMIRAMEDFAPEHNGIDGRRWREILEWCRKYAPFVHRVREDVINVAGASWTPSIESMEISVRRSIREAIDAVNYPRCGQVPGIEYGPPIGIVDPKEISFRYVKSDEDDTSDETIEEIRELARDVSRRLGGGAMVSALLGYEVPLELCKLEKDLLEYGIEVTANFYDDMHRRVHSTVAFNVRVIKGGEVLATELLTKVIEHNRANLPYRLPATGKPVYLVNSKWSEADGGTTPWKFHPDDYSGIPDSVVVRPNEDASYIIGEGGESIRRLGAETGLGEKGVRVVTLPGSPMLPVVLLVQRPRLYADQHKEIARRIEFIHHELHPDPFAYDY